MVTFVGPHSHKPIHNIKVAEGEMTVVGLKKFATGTPPTVVVATADPSVAFCHQAGHLKDTTKHSYNDKTMSFFADQIVPVQQHNLFFFQICGKAAGRTELAARTSGTSGGA
jgi:hypothetical protein